MNVEQVMTKIMRNENCWEKQWFWAKKSQQIHMVHESEIKNIKIYYIYVTYIILDTWFYLNEVEFFEVEKEHFLRYKGIV